MVTKLKDNQKNFDTNCIHSLVCIFLEINVLEIGVPPPLRSWRRARDRAHRRRARPVTLSLCQSSFDPRYSNIYTFSLE